MIIGRTSRFWRDRFERFEIDQEVRCRLSNNMYCYLEYNLLSFQEMLPQIQAEYRYLNPSHHHYFGRQNPLDPLALAFWLSLLHPAKGSDTVSGSGTRGQKAWLLTGPLRTG